MNRIDALAETRARRWRGRIAARLGALSGVRAEAFDGGVTVSGRGLKARWLRDARLRWLGGWM